MATITVEKAQEDLQALVDRALAGEEILIGVQGSAAVKLAPVQLPGETAAAVPSYRGRGVLKGRLVVGPEFFEPVSDEECGLGGA